MKSGLEELVKWLTALTEEDKKAVGTQKLPRETWRDVGDTLERASKSFGEAADRLSEATDRPESATFAEMARDLHYGAQDLARRADVLARRAPEKAPPPKLSQVDQAVLARAEAEKEKAKAEARKAGAEAAAAEAEKEKATLALEEQQARLSGDATLKAFQEKVRAEAEKKEQATKPKPPLEAAADRLRSAQNTVETARGKLEETESPDAVTTSFADELDVLAEMALGLRRRCEELTRSPGG